MVQTEYLIRLAKGADADNISDLLKLAFSSYRHLYTKNAYESTAPEPINIYKRLHQGICWLCECKQIPVGTLSSKIDQHDLYLYGMAVHPDYRNQKIAWKLLEEAVSYSGVKGIRRLYLSTTPFLVEAIRLYENFGFLKTTNPPFDLFGTPIFTMEKIL